LFKPHQGGGSHKGTDTVQVAKQRGEQKTRNDDVEDHEHEQRAVNAPCEVDHRIERQEIQGNLDMGEIGEGPNFLALGSIESPARGSKSEVIEKNAEPNEGERKDRKFRFQEAQGPGSCQCSSNREPANSNEPVDPFYEFLPEKQLLFDQLIPGLLERVFSLFGKSHISSFRCLLQNPFDH
jgi:hypothetical protein